MMPSNVMVLIAVELLIFAMVYIPHKILIPQRV
jgi:hypothetical protein